ncbi:MAG: hypothetical protein M0R39_12930 [Prolixibacteraceae bacterium]|nr:hypothetical protein [Prolixibacteraceae bacterium]
MKKFIVLLIFSVVIAACGTKQQKPVQSGPIQKDTIKSTSASDYGMWKVANYASNLGNNRNTSYITNSFAIWGTFSDPNNDKAELKVKFVIDKETFCMKLLMYGTTAVKKRDETQYKILIKSGPDEVAGFTAKNVSDRIFIKSSDAQIIMDLFEKEGSLYFYLVTDSKNFPATYSFTIDNPIGFGNAFKKINQ